MRALFDILIRVRWHRIFALFFLICAIDVMFQLGLPSDTTSSNARVGEIDIVSMKAEDIEKTLNAYQDSSYLYIVVGDEQYIKKFKDLGIEIDMQAAKDKSNYSLANKLTPFSALWRFTNSADELKFTYDPEVARPFFEEIASFGNVDPEPARLIADNGVVGVAADIPGSSVDVEDALEALAEVDYIDRIEFYADNFALRHQLDEELASQFASQANSYIAEPPLFELDGQEVNVNATNMAEWFEIGLDQETNSYYLALKEEKVGGYLDEVASKLFIPSVGGQVTLLDDQEITRVNGVSGKVLDKDNALSSMQALLAEGNFGGRVALSLTDVSPGVSYERTYSKSNSGLSVYIKDLAEQKGNIRISIVGIDNPGIRASYNGANSIVAASTYKIYVAYHVMDEIEQGRANWADKLSSGRQVDHCLEQAVVVSSNSCALELRDHFGISNINNKLRSIGLSTASVGPAYTSADDLSNFLYKLVNQNILSTENRDKLIDMMRRQIHRLAIPAGVAPTAVADKGGFYGSYNHDTGVVYADSGRYALTIMSSGGKSKATLADVARQVHQFVESI